jgi:hypothetical protein
MKIRHIKFLQSTLDICNTSQITVANMHVTLMENHHGQSYHSRGLWLLGGVDVSSFCLV